MKKRHKAVMAFICSFLICNILCRFYYETGWGELYREHGATEVIHKPNAYFVDGLEGYAFLRLDRNGYNNADGELADDYVLLMGSSHVEGFQYTQDKTIAAVLNSLMGGTQEQLHAYSIGSSGNFLPTVIKGFQAGISEFPSSNAVIIEVNSTSFSISGLIDGLNQTVYDSASKAPNLIKNFTVKQQILCGVKYSIPLVKLVINKQLKNVDPMGGQIPFGVFTDLVFVKNDEEEKEIDIQDYEEVLNRAFALIRDEYDNPIIVFYHPEVELSNEGMELVRDEETYDIFKNACERNDLIFADMGDVFIEAYEKDYTIPYGFYNTEMGAGHTNADGQVLIAKELYRILTETEVKGE